MNLHDMQDLLNNLNAKFKIFTYPEDGILVLRIFHEDQPDYTDITYDTTGKYKYDLH